MKQVPLPTAILNARFKGLPLRRGLVPTGERRATPRMHPDDLWTWREPETPREFGRRPRYTPPPPPKSVLRHVWDFFA